MILHYPRNSSKSLLKYIKERQSPIVITQNGEAKAVMLDVDSYQKMINAMTMMKLIKFSEKDISEGNLVDTHKVFSDIRAELQK